MGRKAEVSIWVRAKDLASKQLTGLRRGLSKVKSAVLSVHGAMIALAAAVATKIGIDTVKAWGVQQQAVIQLNSTLKNTGRFSDEVSRALIKNARDLQAVTTHGDEAIIGATSSLGALATQLSGPELAQAQKAMIGLADQFFGGDVEGAAQLLGKTISSSTNALTRYGIEVDVQASQSEKLNQILGQSAVFFANSQAKALGLQGGMTQLGNVLGDTKEEFGAILSAMLGLEDGAGGATGKISGLNTMLEENRARFVAWGKTVIAFVKMPFRAAWNVIQGAVAISKQVAGAIMLVVGESAKGIVSLVNGAIGGLNVLIRAANKILPKGLELGEVGKIGTVLAQTIADKGFEVLVDASFELNDALKGLADSWGDVAEAAAEAIHTQKEAMAAGSGATGAGGPAPPGRVQSPTAPDRPRFGTPGAVGEALPDPVEIKTLGEQIGQSMQDALGPAQELHQVIGEGMVGALGEFLQASNLAGKGFGDVMVGSIGRVVGALGQMYLLRAGEALADALLHPFKAATSLAAAGKFAALASGAFALSGVLGGGGGGGGGGGRSGASQAFRSTDGLASDRGEATLIIEGGFLDMNDPRQADRLARALGQLSGRRVTVRGR